MNVAVRRNPSAGARIVADVERGVGLLLLLPGAGVAAAALFQWDGHIGGVGLLLAIACMAAGGSLLVAGTTMKRGWRLRWLLQALPIATVAAIVWVLS
jgi:hypothetical protein